MKITGSSRILVPVVILLTVGCGCIPIIPGETTRPPISIDAGLFGPAADPPVASQCTVGIDPPRFSEPGRFDTAGNLIDFDGDDTETIVLRAFMHPSSRIESVERVWSLDEVAVGQAETIAVDITLGEHEIGLDWECVHVCTGGRDFCPEGPELTSRGQASVRITLVGPTTPTALFSLDERSFIGGDLDAAEGVVTVRPDGMVHVVLDGTRSNGGAEATFLSYVWSVDGVVVAFGPVAIMALPIGEHSIQLFVENNFGESHLFELTGIRIVGAE